MGGKLTDYSAMLTDAYLDANSIGHAILVNVCINAAEGRTHQVRFRDVGEEMIVEFLKADEYEWQAALPVEMNYIKRTRFVTNSKNCASLERPEGEAVVTASFVAKSISYLVKIIRDEMKPQNLLEFSVTEVKT